MKILYRIIIMVGCCVPGLLFGMLFAAVTGAAVGSGLAGGAIVLGYGVVGALIAAAVGLVAGLRLTDAMLPWVAGTMGVVLIAFVVYASLRIRSERLSHLDPPEAYEGVPPYALRLERTPLADPVLAKRVLVDSRSRTWASGLSDGRTCTAPASAASLRQAADALEAFLTATEGRVSCDGEPDQIVHWQTDSGAAPTQGRVDLTEACLLIAPEAQRLVYALQQVTLRSNSPIECK
jgi:hypothetical protein